MAVRDGTNSRCTSCRSRVSLRSDTKPACSKGERVGERPQTLIWYMYYDSLLKLTESNYIYHLLSFKILSGGSSCSNMATIQDACDGPFTGLITSCFMDLLHIQLQSVIPSLANGNPSDRFLYPFEMTYQPWLRSLLSCIRCPASDSEHYSKDPWTLSGGMIFKGHTLGARSAYCY